MARKASVRYWPTRGGFCCHHMGRQHLLAKGPDDWPDGPTYTAALKAFSRLVLGEVEKTLTVKELVDKHLEWLQARRKPATLRTKRARLKQFCHDLGGRAVECLRNYDLETWADRQRVERKWSDSTIRTSLAAILSCLRWATSRDVIKVNPVGKVEMPRAASRGAEVVLTPEEEAAVYHAAKGSTKDLIGFLRDTGCRPGEAAAAEARHYDADLRAIVLPAQAREGEATHKTAKTGKARVIYLRGESLAIVQRRLRRNRTGPILRSSRPHRLGDQKGQCWAWTSEAIKEALGRLKKKTGIKRLMAYSFRHTFAVRWLRARKPIAVLAEVMGTSLQMIVKHYGHLADQRDYIRNVVDELDGPPLDGEQRRE